MRRGLFLLLASLAGCGSSDAGGTAQGAGAGGASAGSGGAAAGQGGSGAGAAGAAAGSGGAGAAGASAGSSGAAGSGAAGAGGAGAGAAGSGGAGAAGDGGAAGAGQGGGGGQGAVCQSCDQQGEAQHEAKLAVAALTELSGLAASRVRDGVFYAHNDSGDTARIFAFKLDGSLVSEHRILGASAVDWEDIAAGPCPAGRCLFIGDIGDNNEKRDDLVVYRVDEAALAKGGDVAAEALPIAYPDGPHNAETLMVDPVSGDVLIVTKVNSGKSQVFRFSGATPAGDKTTLELVTALTLPADGNPLATGGDAHPCAPRFLLRTYGQLYEYRAPAGGTLVDAFGQTPVVVPSLTEIQGEAVAYLPQGDGYATSSEGKSPWINVARCP